MAQDLFPLVERVELARQARAQVRQAYQEVLSVFESEHASLLLARSDADKTVEEVETELRAAAVEVFGHDSSSKQLAPGVGIREVKSVVVNDEEVAYAWALRTKLALTLDIPALRLHAAASPKSVPGVTVTTIVQATISQNLGPLVSREQAVRDAASAPVVVRSVRSRAPRASRSRQLVSA